MRAGFGSPVPVIEIAGVKHPTGPTVPLALRVPALLMVLVLVAVGVAWTGLAMAIAAGAKQLRRALTAAAIQLWSRRATGWHRLERESTGAFIAVGE